MYLKMPLRVKKLKENLKCYHITQRLSFNAVYFILIISFSAKSSYISCIIFSAKRGNDGAFRIVFYINMPLVESTDIERMTTKYDCDCKVSIFFIAQCLIATCLFYINVLVKTFTSNTSIFTL